MSTSPSITYNEKRLAITSASTRSHANHNNISMQLNSNQIKKSG